MRAVNILRVVDRAALKEFAMQSGTRNLLRP